MHKTSYQYLQEFCKIKSRSSFDPSENPFTPRADYIINELRNLNLEFKEDEFLLSQGRNFKQINIYVPFKTKKENVTDTILFVAHHDIANPNSENCQDNSASVCNLLELCSLIKDVELEKNVIVCFVDGEEFASATTGGAVQIGKLHQSKTEPFENVQYAINLELTGRGKHLWADNYSNLRSDHKSDLINVIKNEFKDTIEVRTPYSDSVALIKYGIDSVCIGIFNDRDVESYNDRQHPPTWRLCHSYHDSFDKISEEDMNEFVNNILFKLVPKNKKNE